MVRMRRTERNRAAYQDMQAEQIEQKPGLSSGYGRLTRSQRFGWVKIDYSPRHEKRAPAQWQLEQMRPVRRAPSYCDRYYQTQKKRSGAICGAVERPRERRTFLPVFLKAGDAA